jgi:hypothetical protein
MDRLLVVACVVLCAGVAATVFRRRRTEAPTQARRSVPAQLDRRDFDRPDAPWLIVVFSSTTCLSCADAIAGAELLADDDVAVQDVEVRARPDLHRRYAIDSVPVTVVVDDLGVVRASFVGAPAAADLSEAMAGLRE